MDYEVKEVMIRVGACLVFKHAYQQIISDADLADGFFSAIDSFASIGISEGNTIEFIIFKEKQLIIGFRKKMIKAKEKITSDVTVTVILVVQAESVIEILSQLRIQMEEIYNRFCIYCDENGIKLDKWNGSLRPFYGFIPIPLS